MEWSKSLRKDKVWRIQAVDIDTVGQNKTKPLTSFIDVIRKIFTYPKVYSTPKRWKVRKPKHDKTFK